MSTATGFKTPEQRTANLLAFFGWQGGTIHLVEAATGVDSTVLLYGKPSGTFLASNYSMGSSALETCRLAFRIGKLVHDWRCNQDFWLGVADALSVCPEDSYDAPL